jgi:uncharacterized protein (DUF2336 family)
MNVGAFAHLEPDSMLGMASDRSLAARAALAASLSELYFRAPPERSDREQELMAEVLQDLIRDVDTCMREVLVRSAAPRRIPASDMARVLGSDDATEVQTTLRESPNLTDDDLVAITRRRADPYRRAIAERKALSARVADAIVAVAGDDVILRLVANSGAELSADAAASLVTRAVDSPALQALLMERSELSAEQIQRLGATRRAAAPTVPSADKSDATRQALPKWLRRNTAEGTA